MSGARPRAPAAAGVAIVTLACAAGPPSERAPGPPPILAPAGPSYLTVPHWICLGLENTRECADRVEERQLESARRIDRSADTLRIPAANGRTVRLVDSATGERAADVELFRYLGYHGPVRSHLVWIQYYEGSDYLLVDAADGDTARIPSLPYVSPEGRRFAVHASGLSAFSATRLEIWRRRSGGWTREWRAPARLWGERVGGGARPARAPRAALWLAEDTLEVLLEVPGGPALGGEPAGWVTVVRRPAGWRFASEPSGLDAAPR